MTKKIIEMTLRILCFIVIGVYFNNLVSALPVPIAVPKEDPVIAEIKSDLVKLNAPAHKIDKLARAIHVAHKSTNINPKLIIALMKTESDFQETAIGPKNRTKIRYKGLLQTPTASWYSDVDTLHGVRILEEKLKIANNDLQLALALYKGGNNKLAHKQAKEVIRLYESLHK